MLAKGTCLPESLASRFNRSFSFTRVRKSVRHFECLTNHTDEKGDGLRWHLLCSMRTLIRLAMIR